MSERLWGRFHGSLGPRNACGIRYVGRGIRCTCQCRAAGGRVTNITIALLTWKTSGCLSDGLCVFVCLKTKTGSDFGMWVVTVAGRIQRERYVNSVSRQCCPRVPALAAQEHPPDKMMQMATTSELSRSFCRSVLSVYRHACAARRAYESMRPFPKGPCTYIVYTWALKGFPYSSFRAKVYTI